MVSQALKERIGLRQLIGNSSVFLQEIQKIPLVAAFDASVLVSGETGTGKELCARAIHYLSPRAHKPFVPVNCGAIPVELIENELFGHERGAYTGAHAAQPGLLKEAESGTLFLDEIDCLPHLAQVKLLRFLQEKEYRPLGSTTVCSADVRIIAASNSDFSMSVATGKLRADLFYRLNVVRLNLPSLRERAEDIPLLVRHFLQKYAREFNRNEVQASLEVIQALTLFPWPGNVRELEHVIKRAIILRENGALRVSDLDLPAGSTANGFQSFRDAKAAVLRQFERTYIQSLLLAHRGNITRAASAARKHRRAFWALIRKHDIDAESFRSSHKEAQKAQNMYA
jgi:two-component system response regulator GlrR